MSDSGDDGASRFSDDVKPFSENISGVKAERKDPAVHGRYCTLIDLIRFFSSIPLPTHSVQCGILWKSSE